MSRTYVGDMPVYFDSRTKTLMVEEDDVEDVSVGDDAYGDDDYGDDDYGDDYGDDDDDDVGDDDDEAGDDAYDVEGDDEVGGKRRRRRKARRGARRTARKAKRNKGSSGMNGHWVQHIRGGNQITTTGTTIDFTIANNSDFKCSDMTFEGSSTGARISQIWFGDDCVFNPGSGVPISMFGATSVIRGSLKGKICPSGSPIRLVGTVVTATDRLDASFTGMRLVRKSC